MRTSLTRTLTAVMVLVFMLVQGTWVLAGTTGSISGTVSDTNGAPISGATVSVVSPSQSATTQTNAQGKFSFASLAPDTYSINLAVTGFTPFTQGGVTVTADQDNRIGLTMARALAQIGRVTSRQNNELVKAGTIQDVYTVNVAQQQAVQGLGGGGSLNQAYSAIASVPGVYVPQGQQGWAQSVYIRGGNYTSLGYEYDGIPTQRAFDAYPGGTVSALGQQELQVYTGAAPVDASSNGLAGFINQVIRTGTYPLSRTLTVGLGGPAEYHKGQLEISGATPSRSMSYYLAGATYTQNFRYADQFGGAGYQKYNTVFANTVKANCNDPALATAPCYNLFGTTFQGPSGWQPLPYNFGFNNRNVAAEVVGNLHFAIPTKNGRDDVQVLVNNSFNRGLFNEALTSFGSTAGDVFSGTGTYNGVNYASCPSFQGLAAPDPNVCGVNVPTSLHFQDSYRYNGPVGTALTPADLTNISPYYQPKSLQHPFGGTYYDPNSGDTQDVNASVVKLQYQKNFGTDAYLRVYGYTFFTDWLNGNGGPAVGASALNGTLLGFNSPDYNLISHERGLNATFVKQLSDKNLINLSTSYVSASTIRENNAYYSAAGGPVRNVALLVDSTNPTDGICYSAALHPVYCGAGNVAAYRLPAINAMPANGQLSRTAGAPTLATVGTMTCGAGPCEYFTVDSGYRGSYNHVQPKFTTAALSDTWKPNAKLTVDLALKMENFAYDLPDTRTPANFGFQTAAAARTLYNNSYNMFNCFGGPIVGIIATATPNSCPAGTSQVNFNPASASTFTFSYLEPRVGATYQIDRENVLRVSAGQYVQPTNTAYVQYDRVEANIAGYDVPKFYGNGFTDPSHAVRPEKSQNFDFSWEHQIHGTDASFKLTPFLRQTKDEQATVLLDPVTNFVSAINVGQKRVTGVELAVRKGDFARNGLSAQLSYTYTDARLKFKPLPSGLSALDGVNQQIQNYNGFTSFCAAHPTDSRCGANSSGASACYTPAAADGSAAGAPAACGPGTIANPYWNAPVQSLFDPGATYVPYNQLPGIGIGAVSSSYVIPHVASLVLNWRKDRLAITPTLQFQGGGKYGAPTNGVAIDPTTCSGGLGTAPDAGRYPYGAPGGQAYDARSCFATFTGPDRFTGRFDNFGAFTEPSSLTANVQLSYDASKRMTFTLLATNLFNRCFGGSTQAWTSNGDGRVNCWYGSPTINTGNAYNPGTPVQASVAYPYQPSLTNVFQNSYASQANPVNVFLNVSLKL
jgi:hypothetical protein